MEFNKYHVHGINVYRKLEKEKSPEKAKVLRNIFSEYKKWRTVNEGIKGIDFNSVERKVSVLNEYKDFLNRPEITRFFSHQSKLDSTVIEEFLFYLFKDIPELDERMIQLGPAKTYLDLSFAPKNLRDFVRNPGVDIKSKNQDFTISKEIKCSFSNGERTETYDIVVPAVSIECKSYIPITMFDQAAYEAERLKEGNPYALFIIVAEQNALTENVNLKHTKVDEIFILRKQKRSKHKKPICVSVVYNLLSYVHSYLNEDWRDIKKALESGRLINS